jgi:glycosyltransferase involved in cell wall biosynthesis
VIFAEHASPSWGGEAIIPLHYFRILRSRGIEAWMVVHARAREGLERVLPPEDHARIHYVPDSRAQQILYRMGRRLPHTLNYFSFQLAIRTLTQLRARRILRKLVAAHRIEVIHQPIPVSPKEFSLLHGLGAPLVIGPMNGGMDYPPAFRVLQHRAVAAFVKIARGVAEVINFVMPGKLHARTLLVANERTRQALPARVRGRIHTLVENGVDLSIWRMPERGRVDAGKPVRFIFAGRLIDWKGVDILLEAFAHVVKRCDATLEIIGEGARRSWLEEMAGILNLSDKVRFRGWLHQPACAQALREGDVFVLPSLFECGGAVILEAMASGLPVVATNWGGPRDYVDETCGILVEPASRPEFVNGLADAMVRLATNQDLRRQMGDAGRRKVVEKFDWQRKVDSMLEIYRETASSEGDSPPPPPARGRRAARVSAAAPVTVGVDVGPAAAARTRNVGVNA